MKIKVKPEGRGGVYLISKEEAIKLVEAFDSEVVHHQFQGDGLMLGADWSTDSVIKCLNEAKSIALVMPPNFTLGHQLVALTDKRNAFDVGKISMKDLEVI